MRRPPPLRANVRGEGPAVVLLHGQPGSRADWSAVAGDLARDHRVVVPDRLGYGRTGGRAGGFAANANEVVKLMDRLDISSAILTGHSWGGGVALALAGTFPARCAGLVLVATVSPLEAPTRVDRLLARTVIGTALAATSLGTTGRLLTWGPGAKLAGWKASTWGVGSARVEELVRSWRSPGTWRSFAREQQALVYELPGMATTLGLVHAPVVVLAGTADHVVGARAGRNLAKALACATFEAVPGAGHLLPLTHPGSVASAVRRLGPQAPRTGDVPH
ncbi:MAG TPA: alpha/beta hydrolase [Acidimicrobiales bacterium]|nr:alpha/beta hydrolase [Acidimicrobiales bacterium]